MKTTLKIHKDCGSSDVKFELTNGQVVVVNEDDAYPIPKQEEVICVIDYGEISSVSSECDTLENALDWIISVTSLGDGAEWEVLIGTPDSIERQTLDVEVNTLNHTSGFKMENDRLIYNGSNGDVELNGRLLERMGMTEWKLELEIESVKDITNWFNQFFQATNGSIRSYRLR